MFLPPKILHVKIACPFSRYGPAYPSNICPLSSVITGFDGNTVKRKNNLNKLL